MAALNFVRVARERALLDPGSPKVGPAACPGSRAGVRVDRRGRTRPCFAGNPAFAGAPRLPPAQRLVPEPDPVGPRLRLRPMSANRPRSSRRRYRKFVEDYKAKRLDALLDEANRSKAGSESADGEVAAAGFDSAGAK